MATRSTAQPDIFTGDINVTPHTINPYSQAHDQNFVTPSRLTRPHPANLLIAGFPLHDAHLSFPHNLSPSEQARRENELAQELAFQQHHPPILPPSQVPDLPPKAHVGDFLKFPDDITTTTRNQIEYQNNLIAAQHQRIDRERNNMAAKKSRQARIEALANTRTLLNDKAAECAWFRMKAVSLGGSTAEWEAVPVPVRAAMVEQIARRVGAVEADFAEGRKREEARRRTERNKIRSVKRAGRQGGMEGEEYFEAGDVRTTASPEGQGLG